MPRRPASLWIITLATLLLGSWLGTSGLALRLFGDTPLRPDLQSLLDAFSFGPNLLAWLPVSTQGWLRLVIGTGFSGAVMGLWLRQRWAKQSTLLLAFLSMPFLGMALIAAPVIVIALGLPSTRAWYQPVLETDATRLPA